MQKLVVSLAMVAFSSSAFAYITDFDEATEGLRPLAVASKQCRISVQDKVDGLVYDSDEFKPEVDHLRPNVTYLSLWQFDLGPENSNLLVAVTPFAEKDGKILVHIVISNSPGDHSKTGREESVELIGVQTGATQISFHGWSNNKFGFRDDGRQFDTTGTIDGGKFSLAGETAELIYGLDCQF